MTTCVYCDRELQPAPTKVGWVNKPGGYGLCFDCIQQCYEVMVAHRNAEAAATGGVGEHKEDDDAAMEGEAQGLIAAIGCGGDVNIVKSPYVPDDTMIVSEGTWLRLKEAFPAARPDTWGLRCCIVP